MYYYHRRGLWRLACSGLNRQVVLIKGCMGRAKVPYSSASSGLNRQVRSFYTVQSSLHWICTELTALDLYRAHCIGSVQSSLHWICTELTALDLYRAHCIGSVQSSLHWVCTELTALGLYRAHCIGSVQSSLHWICTELTALDFKSCFFVNWSFYIPNFSRNERRNQERVS